jgi:hypothetical protein
MNFDFNDEQKQFAEQVSRFARQHLAKPRNQCCLRALRSYKQMQFTDQGNWRQVGRGRRGFEGSFAIELC